VWIPSTMNISSARAMREMASLRSLPRAQSVWQSANRNREESFPRRRRLYPMRTPVPPGGLKVVIFPAEGVNFSGMLGIDAAFNRVAAMDDRPLKHVRQLRAGRRS